VLDKCAEAFLGLLALACLLPYTGGRFAHLRGPLAEQALVPLLALLEFGLEMSRFTEIADDDMREGHAVVVRCWADEDERGERGAIAPHQGGLMSERLTSSERPDVQVRDGTAAADQICERNLAELALGASEQVASTRAGGNNSAVLGYEQDGLVRGVADCR
jgi:hypothetical protein